MAMVRIGGKVYPAASIEDLPLADVLQLNAQFASAELGCTWGDVQTAALDFADMTEAEAERHPLALVVLAVNVWATRRAAGEDVTLLEAAQVSIKQVEFVAEPGDHKPGKAKGPKKARKAPATPPASGQAATDSPDLSAVS